jgi:hypothetical protein
VPTPTGERNALLQRYRETFEIAYEVTAAQMQPILSWLDDPLRRWPDGRPVPQWAQEFEHMTKPEAEARLQVRAIAKSVAETVLKAVRPDLDKQWSIDLTDPAPR